MTTCTKFSGKRNSGESHSLGPTFHGVSTGAHDLRAHQGKVVRLEARVPDDAERR